jgi:inner membrane protease subunit 2
MQPFLSPDYTCAGRKDVVLSVMHKPWENLRRGMVVAFWYAFPASQRRVYIVRGRRWTFHRYLTFMAHADRSPNDPEKMLIKRVIGIEGDTVLTRSPYPFKTAVVPVGYIWVEGDDGFHSIDSNTYGPVR